MKRLFKLDILLPWAALAVMAGCAHRVPAVAVEAAPVAHIVPLPRSLETRPGTLRIAAAVAVEDAGAAPMARRALDELLATLTDEKQRVIALQPISQKDDATRLCIETCIARNWRLSMQTHKYLNIA